MVSKIKNNLEENNNKDKEFFVIEENNKSNKSYDINKINDITISNNNKVDRRKRKLYNRL